jgi:hypothetical protein
MPAVTMTVKSLRIFPPIHFHITIFLICSPDNKINIVSALFKTHLKKRLIPLIGHLRD